jgi:predicted NAD/FAD-dependent oxidoreductase
MKIALIGAGAAGAACVSVLRNRRADFHVFEKSRGVGGRMTTRRVSGDTELSYDHGCPSFDWPNAIQNKLAPHLNPQTVQAFDDTFVSCPAMPQLVKDLLGSQKITTQFEINRIEGRLENWYLIAHNNSSPDSEPCRFGPFDRVIFTAPAPQSIKILGNIICNWLPEIQKISYSPSWSLMFSINGKTPPVLPDSDDIFEKLILQNLKPARKSTENIQSWVGQIAAEWSLNHLEHRPDDVVRLLLPRALELIHSKGSESIHAVAHRWRYSQVSNSLGRAYLADDEQGLYFASDGCLGQGVAGAIQSGLALGEHLMVI